MAKMVLKCNECGKVFKVSDSNPDPNCPKCGGVDYEVEGVISKSNRWDGNPFQAFAEAF